MPGGGTTYLMGTDFLGRDVLSRIIYGARGSGYCVDRRRSIPCDPPDNQVGRIVQAIVLPEAWMDRVLSHIHVADDVERV